MPAPNLRTVPPATQAAESASQVHGGLSAELRILCVSQAETHARLDAKVLRGLGLAQPRWLASGLEAARYLAEHGADLVLVDEECREMSGLEFVRLIRLHPRLALTPVVALSTDGRSAAVLQAMAAGCSGYCLRPYAPETLLREGVRALRRAPVLAQGILDSLDGQACSEAAFAGKLASLEAIQQEIERAFQPAPAPAPKPACPAAQHRQMAREWKDLGRPDKVRHHLQEGAKALARAGNYHDAWAILDPLRKANPQVEPVCAAAEACVREGELQEAAGLMALALRRCKRPALVYDAARRACCFTPSPRETARRLADALARAGAGKSAPDIYLEIMQESTPTPRQPAERKGLLGAMPSLHDVLVVARHTLETYRKVSRGEAASETRELEGLG